MINRLLINIFYGLMLSMLFIPGLRAQVDGVSITTQQDGDVYIHHTESLPFGYGFNIYRQLPGEEFQQLNQEIIQPVNSGPALVDSLGLEFYNRLQNDLQTEGPTETFLRYKSEPTLALMTAFVYPSFARAFGYLYIDKNAPEGEELTYRIEIVNSQGEPTGQTFTGSSTTTPLEIEAPANLDMRYDGNLVVAEWQYPNPENPEKVAGFNVYRESLDQNVTERLNEGVILHTNNNSFLHTEELPLDGSEYNFYVKAVDITGQEGPAGEKIRFKLVDMEPPSMVQNVNAHVYDNQLVEITWATSVAPDAIGYNVYRAKRSIDPYQKLNDQPVALLNTVYVDSSAQPGNKYVYTITALDSLENESKKSTPAPALLEDHEPPSAPGSLSVSFREEGKTVELEWDHSNRASDFQTYMVLRRREQSNSMGPFSQVNDSTLREFEFEDIGLAGEGFPEGAYFQYGLVAIDSSTNFSDTTFTVFQIPDLEPPESPTFFEAKNNDGVRITLNWNASLSQDVVAYNVYKGDSILAERSVTQRFYRDQEVEIGEEYIYEVTAMDSLENESNPVADTITMRDYSPPPTPRNLQAAFNGEVTELTWESVPNEDLEGYKLMVCDIPTGVYEPLTDNLVTENTYTDQNGAAGRWYRIIAVDSSGNESTRSDPVQAINLNN